MTFRSETYRTRLILPGTEEVRTGQVEVRWDPLTGHSTRLVSDATLLPPTSVEIAAVVAESRPGCPFCADALETQTPRFPPEFAAEGRFRSGAAVLFPNLVDYAQYSGVAVYDPSLHHLPLERLTTDLLADNLRTQADFLSAVRRADPQAEWMSVNANHLPPSGSSIYHPHTQGAAHPVPTTMQRLLAAVAPETYAEYLAAEQRLGARYIAHTGGIHWLSAFAPVGPAEVDAVIPGLHSPDNLASGLLSELADGLSRLLRLYADMGVSSFNLACYGTPIEGHPLHVKLIARSGMAPYYRSDAMYLERLHWEAASGIRPEALAEQARASFTG